jgi:hypothetical protein
VKYTIFIDRWIDKSHPWKSKPFDGYTATLQIDFIDASGKVVEFDENTCSFFENITFVSFNPILKRYKIFQNKKLESIRAEVERCVRDLKKRNAAI